MLRLSTTLLLALLAACSGGSGSGSDPFALGTASMRGTIVELNGQTVNRSGVTVTVLETGATAVTDANGQFNFNRIPAGTVTLDFGAVAQLASLASGGEGQDGSESDSSDDSANDSSNDSVNEMENEMEDESEKADEMEDRDGDPRVLDVEDGEEVEIRCSVDNGEVREFSSSGSSHQHAEIKVESGGLKGEIDVESEPGNDKLEVEVERLAPGTVLEILIDNPADAVAPTSLGMITADAEGQAELKIETKDGDTLPFGVAGADGLSGLVIEVQLAATGETLFSIEIPDLPEAPMAGGFGARERGRAELVSSDGVAEGHVEIRSRPEQDEQRFKMEAEHVAPGTALAFLIEDPDNPGTFVQLATQTANTEGEAEISTQDGLAMPLGVADVSDLVGLEVRVILDDGTGQLLLSGNVPELVAD